MGKIINYLETGSIKYNGIIKKMNDFINKEQLKNINLWKSFTNVFKNKEDNDDNFWRCEFWGKMMRGASLCYMYQNDEELYKILENTVKDMISTQDELGRISTYKVSNEFHGWDMWGRKYVMTAMLHFYEICKDNKLKDKIIETLKKHADYIIDHIGLEENKIKITSTSTFWLGVNSASILEPFTNLYAITKEKRYLDFAKYIIDEGGISEGNLIECAKEHKLLPYQYPEAKAYETMSFFEGVYRYSLLTNNNELKDIALSFFNDVINSEISVTGNAGSDEENFSYAKINQVNKPNKEKQFIQETCVTVTYMRIMSILYLTTGEIKYFNNFEVSLFNNFLGSINFNHQSARDYYAKKLLPPLPFDSYSPLYNDRRGYSTGGTQYLKDGTIYGCCACIGSAGIGLSSLNSVVIKDNDIYINEYFGCELKLNDLSLSINKDFYLDEEVLISYKNESNRKIYIKVPTWAKVEIFDKDNNKLNLKSFNDYYLLDNNLNLIKIKFLMSLNKDEINNKIYYHYGPFVLGIDEESNPMINLDNLKDTDISNLIKVEPIKDSLITFKGKYLNQDIYLKDYSSLGKNWDKQLNRLTVFILK